MLFHTGESLKCSGCGERFSLPLRDHYLYTEGDLDLSPANLNDSPAFHSVLKQRAWCIDCNCPVLVERLPTRQEFFNAAALLKSSKGLAEEFNDELLNIPPEELGILFNALEGRSAKPKCLLCGSPNFVPFEILATRELAPCLLHDSCNSPLLWEGWVGGVVGPVTVRVYSFQGDLLAKAAGVC